MPATPPTLHLFCGKVASGKSTLAKKMGKERGTIVISEDDWLAALFSEQLSSISDYVRCTAKLQDALGPHVMLILQAGLSVVLDFHANTVARRKWIHGIIQASDADHILHYLDVPDDVCKANLNKRNAGGEHPFAVTEEQFDQLANHFVAPSPDEGFIIQVHRFDARQ